MGSSGGRAHSQATLVNMDINHESWFGMVYETVWNSLPSVPEFPNLPHLPTSLDELIKDNKVLAALPVLNTTLAGMSSMQHFKGESIPALGQMLDGIENWLT